MVSNCLIVVFNYILYSVDATEDDKSIGRLINHSRKGKKNLKSKVLEVDLHPHIVFISTEDIKAGDELLYDYGDYSSTSIKMHPWLKL